MRLWNVPRLRSRKASGNFSSVVRLVSDRTLGPHPKVLCFSAMQPVVTPILYRQKDTKTLLSLATFFLTE